MNSTKNQKKRKQSGEKRWLFEEVIKITGIAVEFLPPFNMMAYRFNHPDSMLNNDYGIMALSLF
jgi:hypothetical protein